jgi:hypothetical protein
VSFFDSHRARLTAAAAVTVASCLGAPSAQADAVKPVERASFSIQEPVPQGFSSWDDALATQNNLHRVAERIMDVVERERSPGFGSVEVSLRDRSLSLYWKGGHPASAVTQFIEEAEVPIIVRSSPYSATELEAAIADITGERGQTNVVLAAPLQGARGLRVEVSAPTESLIASPVHMEVTTRPTPVATGLSRWHDTARFWGGGHYKQKMGCTTGVPIGNGDRYMLTAAHCVDMGGTAYTSDGKAVGKVVGIRADLDQAIIQANSTDGSYERRIWQGGPEDDPGSRLPVYAGQHAFTGELICSDGAYSGTRCSIKVTETNVTALMDGITVHGLTEGRHVGPNGLFDHLQAVRHGDSGGPIETFIKSNGTQYAIAQGIISAGEWPFDENHDGKPDYTVSCSGVNSGDCFDTVLFSDFLTGYHYWN